MDSQGLQVSKIQEGTFYSRELLGFRSASEQNVAYTTRCQAECLRLSAAGATEPQEDVEWTVCCRSHLGACSCEVVLGFVGALSVEGWKLKVNNCEFKSWCTRQIYGSLL